MASYLQELETCNVIMDYKIYHCIAMYCNHRYELLESTGIMEMVKFPTLY